MPQFTEERLQKALARLGLASRREAEDWIRTGRLTVNGTLAHLGMRIRPGDQIRLDGRLVRQRAPSHTHVFIYHRSPGDRLREPASDERGPSAIRNTADDWRAAESQHNTGPAKDEFSRGDEPAMFGESADADSDSSAEASSDTLPQESSHSRPAFDPKAESNVQFRAPVQDRLPKRAGRRFIPISPMPNIDGGLELLSSDGELAEKLQRAVRTLQSEFSVRVHGELGDDQRRQIREGVLDHGVIEVLSLSSGGGESSNRWYAIQTRGASGKDVRQLFERQGAIVSRILRTRLGTVTLGRELARGQFRKLTDEELETLSSAAAGNVSSNESGASASSEEFEESSRPSRGSFSGEPVEPRRNERDTRPSRNREGGSRPDNRGRFSPSSRGEPANRWANTPREKSAGAGGRVRTIGDLNATPMYQEGRSRKRAANAPSRDEARRSSTRRPESSEGESVQRSATRDFDRPSRPSNRDDQSRSSGRREGTGGGRRNGRGGGTRVNFSSGRSSRDPNAPQRRSRDQSARGERPNDGSADSPSSQRRYSSNAPARGDGDRRSVPYRKAENRPGAPSRSGGSRLGASSRSNESGPGGPSRSGRSGSGAQARSGRSGSGAQARSGSNRRTSPAGGRAQGSRDAPTRPWREGPRSESTFSRGPGAPGASTRNRAEGGGRSSSRDRGSARGAPSRGARSDDSSRRGGPSSRPTRGKPSRGPRR